MSGDGRVNSQREIASLKIEALARAFEAEGLGLPEGLRSEAAASEVGGGARGSRQRVERTISRRFLTWRNGCEILPSSN